MKNDNKTERVTINLDRKLMGELKERQAAIQNKIGVRVSLSQTCEGLLRGGLESKPRK